MLLGAVDGALIHSAKHDLAYSISVVSVTVLHRHDLTVVVLSDYVHSIRIFPRRYSTSGAVPCSGVNLRIEKVRRDVCLALRDSYTGSVARPIAVPEARHSFRR